ncbi:hypothetical protein FACS1894105_11530 [Clostridia bacterium]|nr:hypothetical protein FACS1894105_11530 [Clostridia bacterium]
MTNNSIDLEIKKLKTTIKRLESTAKTYKEKGDRNYAYYKNGGRPGRDGRNDPSTVQECYLISQNAYKRAKEMQENAEKYKLKLKALEKK